MSVLIETSVGALVVDLFVDACPLAAKNFLKLCKIKYYHHNLFFNVQENFMVQSGDPTGTGEGGESIYGQLYGAQARFFDDEIRPGLRHDRLGLVGLANRGGPNTNGSQFYITTRAEDLAHLDGKHTIFGEVAEGHDVLARLNALYVDADGRPYEDVRILHTHVLEDPFPDPELLVVPPQSPLGPRPAAETVPPRLAIGPEGGEDGDAPERTEEEIEQSLREKEAKSRAVVLEMLGDLPDADVKPPEEALFVCKLNPVTESSDLDMAFCRFGPCKSEVIRDYKTGDSLCYAFVEFQDKRHCEEAYFKMNNVLLDDRRIKVDFSQSVSKLWNRLKRRPWEKPSKSDGDPYAAERKHGPSRRQGPELRLKDSVRRPADSAFELVSDDDDKPHDRAKSGGRRRDRESESDRRHRTEHRSHQRGGSRSRSRTRDRNGERDRDSRSARGDRDRDARSPDRHGSRRRDRDRDHDRRCRLDDRSDREDSTIRKHRETHRSEKHSRSRSPTRSYHRERERSRRH